MGNQFNLRSESFLPSGIAFLSIGAPSTVASLGVIISPGSGQHIRVLSMGIGVNGAGGVSAKSVLSDSVNQVILQSVGTNFGERRFVNGWDLVTNTGLFITQLEFGTLPTYVSCNVEFVILQD